MSKYDLVGRPLQPVTKARIVSFPIGPELWTKVRQQAKGEGRTVKAVMRDAVALYLATVAENGTEGEASGPERDVTARLAVDSPDSPRGGE